MNVTVSFEHLTYSVDESDELVQLALLISNPSPITYTVQVIATDGSATGMDEVL